MSATGGEADRGPERVARFLREQGLDAQPYRRIVGRLVAGASVEELILGTGLPRRLVEGFLVTLGDDVHDREGVLRLDPTQVASYRQLAARPGSGSGSGSGADRLGETGWDDRDEPVGGDRSGEWPAMLSRLTQLLRGRPAPEPQLDQVAALPETLLRRALFLDARYELTGRRVVLLGDHDLTSIALLLVNPEVAVAVCDIDDRILEFVASTAERMGLGVEAYFADLRVGLPSTVRGWADLAFVDPPYTPEGVELFTQRSVEALRDLDHGRIGLAYGYGAQPGLGLKVQDGLARLRVVYEAIVPGFNRYDGAEAVGRASNLYLLRPTVQTAKAIERHGRKPQNVYTHGGQSLESTVAAEDRRRHARSLTDVVTVGGLEVTAAVGVWPREVPSRRIGWAYVLDPTRLPPPFTHEGAVIGDLTHDPGSLLLRALLALTAPHLALLVPNRHPDISSAAGQARLREEIGPKYEIRFLRSTPSPKLAIVEAVLRLGSDDRDAPATAVRRHLLSRAHGKVRNVTREALITVAATAGARISKSEARAKVADRLPHDTGATLLDLPRAEITRHLTLAANLVDELVPPVT